MRVRPRQTPRRKARRWCCRCRRRCGAPGARWRWSWAPSRARRAAPDPALLRLVLKARALWDMLLQGDVAGLGALARREGVSGSYATRLVRAAFLAPDILAAILEGGQPDDLTAARLLQACRRGLPLDWREQRTLLGFG